MKALDLPRRKDVRVETVPDPVLQEPDDIILRVTATAICGSDLHIYRGKIPMMEAGDILGHEFMGDRRGRRARRHQASRRGDRVVVPFTIACGSCFFCDTRLFAACETTNPGPRRDPEQEGTAPGRRAVRLQPSLRRHAGRPGRITCACPRPMSGR